MAKLRVGVVGIRRGAAYVRILKAHPGAELVAVCNRDPKRYEALQASTNELLDGVDYVTDFDELLRRDIDAVVLATTPTSTQPLPSGHSTRANTC